MTIIDSTTYNDINYYVIDTLVKGDLFSYGSLYIPLDAAAVVCGGIVCSDCYFADTCINPLNNRNNRDTITALHTLFPNLKTLRPELFI